MPHLNIIRKTGLLLDRRQYDIIRGAENADLAEVRGAIAEDINAVNFQDPDTGLTALHIVSADRNISIFNEIIKHENLDTSLLDHWNRSATDMAIGAGHTDLAERLMARSFPEFFASDDDPYPPPSNVTIFPSP